MKPFFIYDEKGNQVEMTEKEFYTYCTKSLIQKTEKLLKPVSKYEQYMTGEEKEEFLSLSV